MDKDELLTTLFERYWNFSKLIRFTDFRQRFAVNSGLNVTKVTKSLTIFELKTATTRLIYYSKIVYLRNKPECLRTKSDVDQKSKLSLLNIFIVTYYRNTTIVWTTDQQIQTLNQKKKLN